MPGGSESLRQCEGGYSGGGSRTVTARSDKENGAFASRGMYLEFVHGQDQ